MHSGARTSSIVMAPKSKNSYSSVDLYAAQRLGAQEARKNWRLKSPNEGNQKNRKLDKDQGNKI